MELIIIKGLAICGLILSNITMLILCTMLVEEYINWKGNDNNE